MCRMLRLPSPHLLIELMSADATIVDFRRKSKLKARIETSATIRMRLVATQVIERMRSLQIVPKTV